MNALNSMTWANRVNDNANNFTKFSNYFDEAKRYALSDVCRKIQIFLCCKTYSYFICVYLIIFKNHNIVNFNRIPKILYADDFIKINKHQLDDFTEFSYSLDNNDFDVCAGVHVCHIVYFFFQNHNSVKSRCYMNDCNKLLNSLILIYIRLQLQWSVNFWKYTVKTNTWKWDWFLENWLNLKKDPQKKKKEKRKRTHSFILNAKSWHNFAWADQHM